MTRSFDHDRVSELLPAFLDGTLAEADARAIAGHLETCEDCRSEEAALKALRAPVEPLTSSERLALEHKVMAGIAGDAPASVTELPRRRSIGARVAQTLGAAAVIAAIATFFYLGGGVGGGDDESASTATEGGGVAQEDSEAPRDEDRRKAKNRTAADAAAPEAGEPAALGSGAGGSADTESSFKAAPQPEFTVEDEPFTAAGLQKLGESSLASVRFANYYSADDAEGRNTLLEQLVSSAEAASDSSVAAQVDECGTQVLDTEDPTIPTFGALGELDGQPVLVLGFAFTRQSSGTLDRYMVWAWEEGSCSTAVDFVEGRIETAG